MSLSSPERRFRLNFSELEATRQAGCTASGRWAVLQERVESGIMEAFIEHKHLDEFLINTHAFHNAHLIFPDTLLPQYHSPQTVDHIMIRL
ncbi:hypothetical protein BDZ97DRAFT_1806580 [Flammula alnicola]|nr:hypothetical protein BDZ97DRAFT_1806580 [Flammula alnicola]